jgi:microcystin-dependent protein
MRYRRSKERVGDLKWSIMSLDFEGWMQCDGRSLNRVTYKELFDIIGTTFGSDSEDTFNLPDCRGRGLGAIGCGDGLSARAMGLKLGNETHSITVNELPAHSHSGDTADAGSHTHTHNANGGTLGLALADGNNTGTSVDPSANELNIWTTPRALTINTAGNHSHAFTTGNTGLSNAMNMFQPTIFIGNVFILSSKAFRF